MSMNLYVSDETADSEFDLFQIPTEDSYAILDMADPLEGYKEWIQKYPHVDQEYKDGHLFRLQSWLNRHPNAEWSVW